MPRGYAIPCQADSALPNRKGPSPPWRLPHSLFLKFVEFDEETIVESGGIPYFEDHSSHLEL